MASRSFDVSKISWIIIFILFSNSTQVFAQTLPEFLGVYALDSGRLIELREAQEEGRTRLFGFKLGQPGSGVGGINKLSGISLGKNVQFIFYREIRPVRLSIAKLQFNKELNIWVPVEDISVKIAPIQGRPGMAKIVPSQQLTDGVYMFYAYHPTAAHSFDGSLTTFEITGKRVSWFYDFVTKPSR
jgi:hypothetical protein